MSIESRLRKLESKNAGPSVTVWLADFCVEESQVVGVTIRRGNAERGIPRIDDESLDHLRKRALDSLDGSPGVSVAWFAER